MAAPGLKIEKLQEARCLDMKEFFVSFLVVNLTPSGIATIQSQGSILNLGDINMYSTIKVRTPGSCP